MRDIFAHPAERRDLVQQPVIPGCRMVRLFRQFGMSEISQHAHTIVDRDHHEALFRKALSVVNRYSGRTLGETAAIEVNVYRPSFGRRFRGCPDIEVQAILADGAMGHELVSPRLPFLHDILDTTGREFVGAADSLPSHYGLRRTPAQIA